MQDCIGIVRNIVAVAERYVMGTITHVDRQDEVAALTFDDGPHPEYTPRLLEILERRQAYATFFMVGEAAQRHPEIVRRVAQAGHAIGNHSWDHPSFTSITGRERRAQIRACERAIAPYGQRIFRPPYGEHTIASGLDALCLGYQVITWSLDVGDWWDRDAQRMADVVTSRIQPGTVILFHDALFDGGNPKRGPKLPKEPNVDRESMLAAVKMLLERLGSRFRFITVPELLRQGRPVRQYSCDTSGDYSAWLKQVHMATRQIARLIPPGHTFILVDEDKWGAREIISGRRPIPFLERNGQYWGPPPDDNTAIRELERLRQSGATFIVFGWPAFWWLHYYFGLRDHLRTKFRCVLENDRLMVFDLRS